MIDFSKVEVHRLKDKASPTHLSITDHIRSWLVLKNPRISSGKNIIFKKGANVSICETGFLSIADNAFFHEGCYLLLTMPAPRVEIGKWVFVGRNTIIAAKKSIRIGDFTIIAPNCYFIDHTHGFSKDDIILNQKSKLKEILIGRDCYFGAGTVVLGGVTIGDGAVIASGSVVTKDVSSYEVWAGNPAKFLKLRE